MENPYIFVILGLRKQFLFTWRPVEITRQEKEIDVNAARHGAMRYVTEEDLISKVNKLKKRINYIELSAHLEFTNEYVTQMVFREDEEQVHDELVMIIVN